MARKGPTVGMTLEPRLFGVPTHPPITIASVDTHFTVLWEGWELDNDAWVVMTEQGRRLLLTTDHGGWAVVNEDYLIERIDEYRRVLAESERALDLLRGDDAE